MAKSVRTNSGAEIDSLIDFYSLQNTEVLKKSSLANKTKTLIVLSHQNQKKSKKYIKM